METCQFLWWRRRLRINERNWIDVIESAHFQRETPLLIHFLRFGSIKRPEKKKYVFFGDSESKLLVPVLTRAQGQYVQKDIKFRKNLFHPLNTAKYLVAV